MKLSLDGKTALVCGASQGIGFAAAVECAQLGARVVCLARNGDLLNARVRELPGSAKHACVVADLSRPDEADAAVADWMAREGNIHILVNNAGGPKGGPLLEAREEDFLGALSTHVLASLRLVRRLVPGMIKDSYGRVVNVVSVSVRTPIANLGVSNTTRAAMAGWAKSLSNELAPHGITVNNVLPGYTRTERLASLVSANARQFGTTEGDVEEAWRKQVPLGRFAEASEVAAAIAFLASPAAAYITGQSLAVDGGRIPAI